MNTEEIVSAIRQIEDRLDAVEELATNIERVVASAAQRRLEEFARSSWENCVRRSILIERHHIGWTKLANAVPDFVWRGISAAEYLRKPQPEPPELQSVADAVVSDSYAVFRRFDERGQDQNIVRWLPVLLDAANNYFVRIEQRLVALADVPTRLGTFQRFERVPVKRLYETSTGRLVPAA